MGPDGYFWQKLGYVGQTRHPVFVLHTETDKVYSLLQSQWQNARAQVTCQQAEGATVQVQQFGLE